MTSAITSQDEASQIASTIAEGAGQHTGGQVPAAQAHEIASAVQTGFADATQVVFYVMAVAFVVSLVGLRRGRQEQIPDDEPLAIT